MRGLIAALQAELAPREAMLVESPASRRYLTGFASSDGAVVITAQDAAFLTDFRYIEKARATVTACRVEMLTEPMAQIAALLEGCDTLYVEPSHTSLRRHAALAHMLDGITVSTDGRMERELVALRQCKTPRELAAIRAAQALTDDTFSYILERIEAGRTEREIVLDMEFYMRRHGSEGVAFDTIVVAGAHSSMPHGVPTDTPIARGDFVTMDFGAVVDGYRADMTRTVAVGSVTDEMRAVYDTVLTAQTAALAVIHPDAVCKDIDAIARDLIDGAGYGGCFGHGLGHSVGLEIHESPAFNMRCDTPLAVGMVMTVEPGIYLDGRFGVRIEDMVAVTPDGCDNLTHSEKTMIIL